MGNEKKQIIEWEDFLKYRDVLMEREWESSKSYDKHLLTLSTGAIAISLYIFKELFGKPVEYPSLLFVSWTLLLITICSTLISFIASSKSHTETLVHWNDCYTKNKWETFSSCWNIVIEAAIWISLVSFIGGIITLCIFAAINI